MPIRPWNNPTRRKSAWKTARDARRLNLNPIDGWNNPRGSTDSMA
jgi:hypothetical protein